MKKALPLSAVLIASLAFMGSGCAFLSQEEPTSDDMMEQPNAMQETEDSSEGEMMEAMEETSATHTVNLETSKVSWAAEKITGAGHYGTISLSSGTLTIDEEGMIQSGTFVLDMTTINSEDAEGKAKEGLENHLRSADFFDVENHPQGMFTITSVETTEEGLIVNGDLTLKGITNSISFPATLSTENETMLSTADVTIDRTLWDIQFGSGKFFEDLGDNLIKDEIEISMTIEAEKI